MRLHRRVPVRSLLATVALTAALGASGCKKDTGPARTNTPETPARRAAMSFVHCVEQSGPACVGNELTQGAWDAFSILGWLADGSPTAILEALPRELSHHANARSVQQRFVNEVSRQDNKIRGAECEVKAINEFGSMVPKLREAAQRRLEALGMWRGDLGRVVDGLANEATEGLQGGYLVTMQCQAEPWQVYVATAIEGERHVVVGLMVDLPEFLGGDSAARDATSGRLRTIDLGTRPGAMAPVDESRMDPWLPFPVEEF